MKQGQVGAQRGSSEVSMTNQWIQRDGGALALLKNNIQDKVIVQLRV